MSDDAPRVEELQMLGKRYLDVGDLDAARDVLTRCLPLAEAEGKMAIVVNALSMLASRQTRLMQFDDADSTYQRAIRVADERLTADDPARVSVMLSRAAFERGRGELEREKRVWQTLLPVLQKAPQFKPWLKECERCLQELATRGPEEQALREAFESARVADMPLQASFTQRSASFEAVQRASDALALLLGDMGRIRERDVIIRDGLMMRPQELWRRLTAINAPFRRGVLHEQRCRFNLFLRHALKQPRAETAQTALETILWRRGIALEIHRCANQLARRDPEARRLLDTIRFNRALYAAEVFEAPSDAELRPGKYHTNIVLEPIERNFDYQDLEAQLHARLGPQSSRFVAQPASCAELASKLPDGGLLIEFWRCTWPGDQGPVASYVALVLPKDRPDLAAVVLLCDAATLEETLLEYLSLLSGRSKTADFGNVQEVPPDPARARQLGDTIRQLTLDALQPWVDRARHLVLVPDGLLNRLPFSALPVGDGYLLDQWLVSYLHSARDLFGNDELPATAGDPVVFCDPAYAWPGTVERTGGFRCKRLQYAAEEGAAVAGMLGVTPLTGDGATKPALATIRSPKILHIATHGSMLAAKPSVVEFDALNPMVWTDPGEMRLEIPGSAIFVDGLSRLSGRQVPDQALRSIVALAGINTWLDGEPLPDEAGNGVVTAEDIAAIDLAGNELTVLSACETGLGVIGVGEGVLGLGSSLAVAGAETVVTTLWNADDVATKELMVAFYQRLLNGNGRAEALHEAQKAIRKQYPDDPFYWSPFILHGAFGSIRARREEGGS